MVRITRVVGLVFVFLFAQTAFAKKGALIDYDDGKATPQLAKSWKKVKDGEYEFELDLGKEVQGKKLDASMVKATLEKKLAKKYGVSVTAKSASSVSIVYTTEEDKFLQKVAKTKIRANSVELAMQGNVSDGGLRADQKIRSIKAGEVSGTVLSIKDGIAKVMVIESKTKKVKSGKVKVNMGKVEAAKANRIIFSPTSKSKAGAWGSKAAVEVYK